MSLNAFEVAYRGRWANAGGQITASGLTVGSGNNSQALAVALTSEVNVISTSSATASTGVRLMTGTIAGDSVVVANLGASATLVYPAVGGKINGGSTNAGFSVGAGKVAVFHAVSGTDWVAVLSA